MREVSITARDPVRLGGLIGSERSEDFVASATETAELLRGRAIVNVNSTESGGGVAEMLHVLVGYVRGAGLDGRWLVIEADRDFFVLTKRLHNHLYGSPGDGGDLGPAEHELYRRALEPEGDELAATTRDGDVVILHDPQTAGLAEKAVELGCRVVWRCHIGSEEPNENEKLAWDFLRPYLEPYVNHYVFTDDRFAPDWVPPERRSTVWPSIDPFSPKNQAMTGETTRAILTHVGILAGLPGRGSTSFVRSDGSPGRVERFCDVFRTGPAAEPGAQMVTQISRWDAMKDMAGVMDAFATHVDSGRDAELVLAGPAVSAVADDPEGAEVLRRCWDQWRQLPHALRRRVQLVCLPMHDAEENSAIVNALQRHSTVVVQKSLAEGFGLTVAEAMLKGTAVVGTAVGGIAHQIIDEETGLLVGDPRDGAEFGAAVCRLLDDDELRARLATNGRRRAESVHLVDVHLGRWAEVLRCAFGEPGSVRA